jgi:cell division protease FtsH
MDMFPPRPPQKTAGKPNKPKPFINAILTTILFFVILIIIYSLFTMGREETKKIPISEVATEINSGNVKKIEVAGDKLLITFIDDTKAESKKEEEGTLSETLFRFGVLPERLGLVAVEIKSESGFGFWLLNVLPFLIPIIFILLFFYLMTRSVKGMGTQAFTFGQSKARLIDPQDKGQRITFKDVAGVKEAKEELKEIVDFLRSPKKFIDIGAKIPKGVLLMGPAGTGKTLLARAVAGEAQVPFFHISGSEFVELFVGVGASRVRDLFAMAKKAAPAIIFVDEIDAVGRVRGVGLGGGNDEREQTLNQILVEMDGFEPNEKIIVMAATNRADVLDPALVRPGRFDRRVVLDLPDRGDREEILKIHAKGKPFAEDVKIEVIAARTPGFSGADLYSLMNEAAILAAREDRKKVSQYDLIRSIEKVILGPERKSHLFSPHERKITAYHEGGHALVASVLPNADPVHKVSIVARGHAGGYTMNLPIEERKLKPKKAFMDAIAVSLGGFAAEQMIFGDTTTGPASDLEVATATARAMVTKWGMSEEIGPIAVATESGRPLLGVAGEGREYSEAMSAKIDAEVKKIIDEALTTAKKTLKTHKKALDAIAEKLIEVETLEQEEYNKIITAFGILPKKELKKEMVK